MSELTLRECPFCGGTPRHWDDSNPQAHLYRIKCDDCYAEIRTFDKATAFHNWNRRHQPTCETCKWLCTPADFKTGLWICDNDESEVPMHAYRKGPPHYGCIYHEAKEK